MKNIFFLIPIIFIGVFFRFYNLDWDQGHHLHPDERFLTMVGSAVTLPSNFTTYLNPQQSPLNPMNHEFLFFVYGILPITLNKIIAFLFYTDTFDGLTLQGRFLSAVVDSYIMLIVYRIVLLFETQYKLHHSIKFLATFFYAIAVLPIQLAHFFTVDTFLTFFSMLSFYYALRFYFSGKSTFMLLSSTFLGLAIACKISGVYLLPLLFSLLIGNIFFSPQKFLFGYIQKHLTHHNTIHTVFVRILCSIVILIVYCLGTYLTLRLGNPYLFSSSNILHPAISPVFMENIRTLKSWEGPDVWFPPSVQWIHTQPVTYAIKNIAFYGVGLPYFFFIICGSYILYKKHRHFPIVVITIWSLLFFLYQSNQFSKNMRYFLFLYPLMAIVCAIGFSHITKRFHLLWKIVFMLSILVWPLAFFSIYVQPHSRVRASAWIYQHVTPGSILLTEHWDDPLPFHHPSLSFRGIELPVFDRDTSNKKERIHTLLRDGDYLILSSNRGWGSIQTVPEKYPWMSKWYNDLFTGKLSYALIQEFTSYPSLAYLGIPLTFPDQDADESFTVYDHPTVKIFKNTSH